jgi:hypothetical protein
MIRRLSLTAAALLWALVALGAQAQEPAISFRVANLAMARTVSGGGSYVGPGDIATFTDWYGVRAYDAAEVTACIGGTCAKLFNIERASDSQTCDFLINTSGGVGDSANCSGAFGSGSLSSFCAATTCTGKTWYTHTGSGRNLIASGTVSFLASCVNGTLPCFYDNANAGAFASSASFTPASGIVSFSVLCQRNVIGSVIYEYLISENGTTNPPANNLSFGGGANAVALQGGTSGDFNATASDGSPHAVNSVINGASPATFTNVDGTATTGSDVGATGSGNVSVFGNAGGTGIQTIAAEAGFADNIAFSSGQVTSLHSNMSAYFGTP